MGKVFTQFTMSLDGFIAGPNDEIAQIFRWYRSGDTDFPVPGTPMVFKIARASADLLGAEWGEIGAIVTGRRDFDVSDVHISPNTPQETVLGPDSRRFAGIPGNLVYI